MSLHPVSKMIRTRVEQTPEMEHSSPIFLTSSFSFDNAEEMRAAFADETDDNIYSRFSNPSVQEFTDRMCVLEGMESGFATASSMSAVFASMLSFLKKGDHLLSCNAIFGSTHTVITKILPKYGIEYTYVPAGDLESWEGSIQKNTKLIYLETPTNPGLDLIDLQVVGDLAKKHGLIYCVDNCFATPIGQLPAEYGADLIVHSATSWLKYPFLKSHPQYGIAKKQMKNGGGLFCFELKGGLDSGRKFLDNLKMLSRTANLGDTRSIASHPASTTHAKLTEEERRAVNITPGLIRISCGLEHREDILNDIVQALASI